MLNNTENLWKTW